MLIFKAWYLPLLLVTISCYVASNAFQLRSSLTRTLPRTEQSFGRTMIPYLTTSTQINRLSSNYDISLQAEAVSNTEESYMGNTKVSSFPIVLWRFTRPHTLIGSALAIPALHILAAPTFQDAFKVKTAISALYAMIPSLLMNLYITGLNQITDVDIDKVNKPKLPIAAGDLSVKTATTIVVTSLILSLLLGAINPVLGTQGLNIALWGSMILGTLYSLPPFRLKRFPLLAAFCIVAVRGTIINAGFYAHAKVAAFSSAGASVTFMDCMMESRCFLSSLFFAIFGVVIGMSNFFHMCIVIFCD